LCPHAELFDVARWALHTGMNDFTLRDEVDELVLGKKLGVVI
jgi:hypothetical protein